MKNILFVFVILSVILGTCQSCGHSEKKHEFIELGEGIDLGKGTYRPNPFKFLDNIPPFSWMGMPDSVKKETELQISFNEDAVRSASSGQLALVDQKGNYLSGITLGGTADKFSFKASGDSINLPISMTINPAVGDSVLTGSIVFLGDELDQVNDTKLSSGATPVASWTLTHKVGINWLRWIILILIIVSVLYMVGIGIFYGGLLIGSSLNPIASGIGSIFSKISSRRITQNENNNRSKQQKEEKRREEKRKKNLHPYLRDRQTILRSSARLRNKAMALYEILLFLDYDIDCLPNYDRDEQCHQLDQSIRDALDDLWDSRRGFYLSPNKKNGIWTGEPKNSIWIPEDSFIPKNNSSYSNVNGKKWSDIKRENAFIGLNFNRGIPQFQDIAKEHVTVLDFGAYIDPLNDGKRTALHEKAFELLAEKMGTSIGAIKKWKEDQNKPLVWHEHVDCYTMYLVPQEIHGNIKHFGGIAMLKILRKNNLTNE